MTYAEEYVKLASAHYERLHTYSAQTANAYNAGVVLAHTLTEDVCLADQLSKEGGISIKGIREGVGGLLSKLRGAKMPKAPAAAPPPSGGLAGRAAPTPNVGAGPHRSAPAPRGNTPPPLDLEALSKSSPTPVQHAPAGIQHNTLDIPAMRANPFQTDLAMASARQSGVRNARSAAGTMGESSIPDIPLGKANANARTPLSNATIPGSFQPTAPQAGAPSLGANTNSITPKNQRAGGAILDRNGPAAKDSKFGVGRMLVGGAAISMPMFGMAAMDAAKPLTQKVPGYGMRAPAPWQYSQQM